MLTGIDGLFISFLQAESLGPGMAISAIAVGMYNLQLENLHTFSLKLMHRGVIKFLFTFPMLCSSQKGDCLG